MTRNSILILLSVWLLVGCDRVKHAAQQALSAVSQDLKEQDVEKRVVSGSIPLQQLVDETDQGVVFRKDLPFPKNLEVKFNCERNVSGRAFTATAMGQRATPFNGSQITESKWTRAGGKVDFEVLKYDFDQPAMQGMDPRVTGGEGAGSKDWPTLTFYRRGDRWKVDGPVDFTVAAISQTLEPRLDQLLIEYGLAPRALWFGRHRLKPGDELDVSSEAMAMLVPGETKGLIHMKLEAVESLHGHPCGIFAIHGDLKRKGEPDAIGNLVDRDLTIESGRLWLSLLYPVVLKGEMEAIESFKSGASGGSVRFQGTSQLQWELEWNVIGPAEG